jgi:hypothetical protein
MGVIHKNLTVQEQAREVHVACGCLDRALFLTSHLRPDQPTQRR